MAEIKEAPKGVSFESPAVTDEESSTNVFDEYRLPAEASVSKRGPAQPAELKEFGELKLTALPVSKTEGQLDFERKKAEFNYVKNEDGTSSITIGQTIYTFYPSLLPFPPSEQNIKADWTGKEDKDRDERLNQDPDDPKLDLDLDPDFLAVLRVKRALDDGHAKPLLEAFAEMELKQAHSDAMSVAPLDEQQQQVFAELYRAVLARNMSSVEELIKPFEGNSKRLQSMFSHIENETILGGLDPHRITIRNGKPELEVLRKKDAEAKDTERKSALSRERENLSYRVRASEFKTGGQLAFEKTKETLGYVEHSEGCYSIKESGETYTIYSPSGLKHPGDEIVIKGPPHPINKEQYLNARQLDPEQDKAKIQHMIHMVSTVQQKQVLSDELSKSIMLSMSVQQHRAFVEIYRAMENNDLKTVERVIRQFKDNVKSFRPIYNCLGFEQTLYDHEYDMSLSTPGKGHSTFAYSSLDKNKPRVEIDF